MSDVPVCQNMQLHGWRINCIKSESGRVEIVITTHLKKKYHIPFGFSFLIQGLNTILTATEPAGLRVPFETVTHFNKQYVLFVLEGTEYSVDYQLLEEEMKRALQVNELNREPVPDGLA